MEYLPWILVALFVLSAVFGKSSTWSPFQSRQVRNICAHMTAHERRASIKRSVLHGATLGATFGAVLFAAMVLFQSALVLVVGGVLILPLVQLAFSRKWRTNQQRHLASTAWAQAQGIAADEIKLHTWQE